MQEEYAYETALAAEEARVRALWLVGPAAAKHLPARLADAPLFGGKRQGDMFSDLDTIDERHDNGGWE